MEPDDYVLGRSRVFLRLGRARLLERMLSLPPEQVLPELELKLAKVGQRRAARYTVRRAARDALFRRREKHERARAAAAVWMQARARGIVGRRRAAVRAEVAQREAAEREAAAREAQARLLREAEAREAAGRAAAETEAQAQALREAKAARELAEREARAAEEAAAHARALAMLPKMHLLLDDEVTGRDIPPAMSRVELALEPALHHLFFAHWDWGSVDGGGGEAAAAEPPRSPLKPPLKRGPSSVGLPEGVGIGSLQRLLPRRTEGGARSDEPEGAAAPPTWPQNSAQWQASWDEWQAGLRSGWRRVQELGLGWARRT